MSCCIGRCAGYRGCACREGRTRCRQTVDQNSRAIISARWCRVIDYGRSAAEHRLIYRTGYRGRLCIRNRYREATSGTAGDAAVDSCGAFGKGCPGGWRTGYPAAATAESWSRVIHHRRTQPRVSKTRFVCVPVAAIGKLAVVTGAVVSSTVVIGTRPVATVKLTTCEAFQPPV